ncbi:MAG: anthranilate phosphoribosyltransferase [Acidimicrobiia bacterium]
MGGYDWADTLTRLISRDDLTRDEAHAAMSEVMGGRATPAQIAALMVAVTSKHATADEMTGFVDAMYDEAVSVAVEGPIVDLVGTGGDRSGTFNISTTAALIAAGAGVKIAKHGNRAASSQAGSADLLEAMGVRLDLTPEETTRMIDEIGFGFLFAPLYHPALRHAAPVRRDVGVRTVFNFLGPLCNPARPVLSAVGVSDPGMAERMIHVLANRGAQYAFVYFGRDGLDELSTAGPSFIYRLRHGEITTAEFTPEDFGVPRAPVDDVRGGTVEENVAITRSVLAGARGPHRDIALVNATPAIVVAEVAEGFVEAMELAAASVDSGDAQDVLDRAVAFSRDA